jgi:large subunit ribosomal protein L15
LVNAGLIGKNSLVKILGRGEIKTSVEIIVDKFSKSAENAIIEAGGSIKTL